MRHNVTISSSSLQSTLGDCRVTVRCRHWSQVPSAQPSPSSRSMVAKAMGCRLQSSISWYPGFPCSRPCPWHTATWRVTESSTSESKQQQSSRLCKHCPTSFSFQWRRISSCSSTWGWKFSIPVPLVPSSQTHLLPMGVPLHTVQGWACHQLHTAKELALLRGAALRGQNPRPRIVTQLAGQTRKHW